MSDYICEELIFEIFTRLPPKSLLRFRTLSKSICSYISSPDFIRLHTFRSPEKLMIRHHGRGIESFYTLHSRDEFSRRGYTGTPPLEFVNGRYSDIVGSCNGILCLVDCGYHISLWNPSIRRKLTVPDAPLRYHFRPIGFGFDPSTDDYKIVCIATDYDERDSFVYATKTGYWCQIYPPRISSFQSFHGCFVNGALHWVVDKLYILTFDLSTHDFGEIALPEPSREIRDATTIQGSLAVISKGHEDDIWIWVMKEYNNTASWSAVFKLKANEVRRVLQLTNNGDLLFNISYVRFEVYDPKIGSLSRLRNFNEDCYIVDMKMYVESLQLFDMKGMEACGGNRLSILKEKRSSKDMNSSLLGIESKRGFFKHMLFMVIGLLKTRLLGI